MDKPAVVIELTHDEALVLSDWLASSDLFESLPAPSEADRSALWSLEARLDEILVEPFAPNYKELVAAARRRLTTDENAPPHGMNE